MEMIGRMLSRLVGLGRGELAELVLLLRARMDTEAGGLPPLAPHQRAAYDRMMDALNRLPRPLMALGTLAILAAALIDPVWFAARMEALAAMPEPMWWLIGGVISLYFGARFQSTEQAFQREIVATIAQVPPVIPLPGPVTPLVATSGADADLTLRVEASGENAALADWSRTQA